MHRPIIKVQLQICMQILLGVGAQVLAVAGCMGGFHEERSGLPHAGHSRFQMPPTDPLQPLSQDGGASGEAYLRKGRKC